MKEIVSSDQAELFKRVITILEEARGNVVRAVNTNMVTAYWLIGREIVQVLQGGEERAEYGKQIVEALSKRLTERYGRGFLTTNLWYFRQFFQAYPDRLAILHPTGGESGDQNLHISGHGSTIGYPVGSQLRPTQDVGSFTTNATSGFSPRLTWSHYRALMRVQDTKARDFYEHEAIDCGWSKTQLERQIHSYYYERSGSDTPLTAASNPIKLPPIHFPMILRH